MVVRVTNVEEKQSDVLKRVDNLEKNERRLRRENKGSYTGAERDWQSKAEYDVVGLAETAEEIPVLRTVDETAKLQHIINEALCSPYF